MMKLFTIVTLFSAMVWASEVKSWELDNWMSVLKDTKLITQITIPGTHDSATDWDHCVAQSGCNSWRWFVSCQTYNIPKQLEKGIRFFDIRLAYKDGVLKFYHGPYYLGQHFDYAIDAAQDFLETQKSKNEFVIFLVKQEHTSVSADAFWGRANSLYFNSNKYKDLFYLKRKVPTVEEARGKIIIMGREASYHPQGYHVQWDKNTTHYEHYSHDKDNNNVMRYIVEDHYSMYDVDPKTKFAWIAQNIYLSGFSTPYGYKKTLFITFLSGEGDPKVTKTPRKIAKEINLLTANWLPDRTGPHPGIVAIDLAGDPEYYGDKVVKAVIDLNFD